MGGQRHVDDANEDYKSRTGLAPGSKCVYYNARAENVTTRPGMKRQDGSWSSYPVDRACWTMRRKLANSLRCTPASGWRLPTARSKEGETGYGTEGKKLLLEGLPTYIY